jgi:hypothetical protein
MHANPSRHRIPQRSILNTNGSCNLAHGREMRPENGDDLSVKLHFIQRDSQPIQSLIPSEDIEV